MIEADTETNLPLPQFYANTIKSLSPILDDTLSTSLPSTQSILQTAIDNLYLISRMLSSLGVFSDNETIDELADREIVFMTVGWVLAEAESKTGLSGRDDRMNSLRRSETAMNSFLNLLSSYHVLSSEEEEDEKVASTSSAPRDPAKRREAKIRQYKREKELKEKISTMTGISSTSPAETILALLESKSTATTSVNPESQNFREASILFLHLLHILALQSLSSTAMELSLLSEAPASISELSADPNPRRPASEEDNTWKLDRQPATYKPKELISGGGKVLRPFTILPSTSGMSDRARFQNDVFREKRNLPTMTIDEYLEEERRRGNIITGGGQASYDAPTTSELLELAAENDGTREAEEKEDEKRQKEENWAVYTEANPRGAGNTMNRG